MSEFSVQEFRGLSHVVDVWRNLSIDQQLDVWEYAKPLATILTRADQYMGEIERQESVNGHNSGVDRGSTSPRKVS